MKSNKKVRDRNACLSPKLNMFEKKSKLKDRLFIRLNRRNLRTLKKN